MPEQYYQALSMATAAWLASHSRSLTGSLKEIKWYRQVHVTLMPAHQTQNQRVRSCLALVVVAVFIDSLQALHANVCISDRPLHLCMYTSPCIVS